MVYILEEEAFRVPSGNNVVLLISQRAAQKLVQIPTWLKEK